ncbi:hypothetical protein M378DRAFT_164325 [Amanita muscaria Koide BX008]|uniref:Secreted protein n=1 Tax=Amanita muscaria (strain Koide BX008) TaxID=946122 RepID=A0A0C2WPQ5_AMAMK|nr:hypothetical protein M378DRAFT_164325 [Amanita muscaria Koide BX008]
MMVLPIVVRLPLHPFQLVFLLLRCNQMACCCQINAQHRFASPGIMSPMLYFVSEFGELGDIASESNWSSDSWQT